MTIPDGSPFVQTKIWFYAEGDQKRGPYTAAELKDLVSFGVIQAQTLIWKQGLQNWIAASQVKGLFPPVQSPPLPQAKAIPDAAAPPPAPAIKPAPVQDSDAGDVSIPCYGCGKQIQASAAACPNCGAPKQTAAGAAASAAPLAAANSASVKAAPPPAGVKGWSWGAFLLNWVWAIGNRTWIGLLAFVPVVGILVAIILGIKGREWAWKNKSWKSIEHFNAVQRRWSIWGFVVTLLGLVGVIGYNMLDAGETNRSPQVQSSNNTVTAEGNDSTEAKAAPTFADVIRNVDLRRQQVALQQECFGDFTNTCTSKNIDFDIAVLKAYDTEHWIPFVGLRSKEKMIEVFGANGWDLFEQAVNTVRDEVIARLESKRPSTVTLWFRGDDQPLDGGVRAFFDADDLVPTQTAIRQEFTRLLLASGWKPTPEIAARYGDQPTPAPAETPKSPSEPSPKPDDKETVPEQAAPTTPSPSPASQPSGNGLPFVGTREFNFWGGTATQESIKITPDGTTQIQMCGDASMGGTCTVEYSGIYKNPMQASDGSGWLIQGDQMIQMKNGQAVTDCGDDGHQKCTSSLDPVDGK